MKKKNIISILGVAVPLIAIAGFSGKYFYDKENTKNIAVMKVDEKTLLEDNKPENSQQEDLQGILAKTPTLKQYISLTNGTLVANKAFIDALYKETGNGIIELDGKEFYFNKDGMAVKGLTNSEGIKYFNNLGELQTGWRNIDNNFYKFVEVDSKKDVTLNINNSEVKVVIPSKENGNAKVGSLNSSNLKLTFNDDGKLAKIIDKNNNDTFSGQNLKSFVRKNPELGKYINLNSEGYVINISPVLAKALHANPASNGWIELGHCNYYFDIDGNLIKGFYTNENGETTLSNQYGEMDVGFKTLDGKFYYMTKQNGRDDFNVTVDGQVLALTVWGKGSGIVAKNASLKIDNTEFIFDKTGMLKTIKN